ncbi:BON domain-containing protein [Marinobacterium aestuariivivens]|uniref:BON domain-containing protein n=1 Tax=Marinobacterium aestuariivivens TaxID=1698799 RepID=A0ABW1ZXL2_9GAMM
MIYNRNVDGSDIDVETQDGVVTLRGQVDSDAERELALSIASDIKGVESVKSELTGG